MTLHATTTGWTPVNATHSPDARALGAMLASERWYETAAAAIVTTIYQHDGNAVHTAKALNVSWRSLRDWSRTYPELQRALEDARARSRRRKQARPLVEKVRPGEHANCPYCGAVTRILARHLQSCKAAPRNRQ